jgi:hypothetical protein
MSRKTGPEAGLFLCGRSALRSVGPALRKIPHDLVGWRLAIGLEGGSPLRFLPGAVHRKYIHLILRN